jgi:hypothetical protein
MMDPVIIETIREAIDPIRHRLVDLMLVNKLNQVEVIIDDKFSAQSITVNIGVTQTPQA